MRKYPWFEDLDGVIYCPTCQHCLSEDDSYDLEGPCPRCGQELDWEKTIPWGWEERHK